MSEIAQLPSMAFSRSGNDTASKGPKKAPKPKPKPEPKRADDKKGKGGGAFVSLRAAKRDVFDLGAGGLSKRQRKIREDAKLQAFGAKAPKNPKLPFKMLMGIRKAEAKREKKIADERREAGVVAPKEKRDLARGGAIKKKRKGRADLAGESRDGVLRVDHLLKKKRRK